MKIAPLIVAIFSMGLLVASAANPELEIKPESLPKGPLLKRIPDFTSWRISFFYAKDKIKPTADTPVDYGSGPDPDYLPAPIRSITLTRTRPRYLVVSEDVKGHKAEQCGDGQDEWIKGTKKDDVFLVLRDPTIPFALTNFGKVDFPDLEWISAQNFKGMQNLNDRRCMVFSNGGMFAWIDLDSRLPVLWKREGETRSFQQLPPPSQMLEFPPKIKEVSEKLRRERERFSRPIPRGG